MSPRKLVLKPFPLNPRLTASALSKPQLKVASAAKAGKNILVEGEAFSGKSVVLLHCLRDFVERAKKAQKNRLYQQVWGIAPNRPRVENLNNSAVVAETGLGRLFRTPAGMAFAILEEYFQKAHPELPTPRLFTGDQEAAKLAEIVKNKKPTWENLPYQDPLEANLLGQLRDLYDTCAQWGISSYDLDILGKHFAKPNWRTAANKVFTYYQPHPTDQHWNQSSLQARAIEILEQWHDPELLEHALTLPELLLVEDLQDMPASTAQLILALARAGVQVVAVSNPKLAVENYRGGNAENQRILLQGKTYSELLGDLFSTKPSGQGDSQPLLPQVEFIHLQLPSRRAQLCLNRQEKPAQISTELEFLTANSDNSLFRNIAVQLRKRHVLENIPWEDMAVILRNQEQVEAYREGLENYDIPVLKTQHSVLFKNHFATAPLLNIFYYAHLLEKNETLDKSADIEGNILLNSIFNSDYLALDSYQICKLKQGFEALNIGMLRQESTFKHHRLEDFLRSLGTAGYQPVSLPNLAPALAEMERLHHWIWQAGECLGDSPLDGIDKIWQTINLAEKWAQAAIEGDRHFDEALDGINSLYAHAKSWQEAHPEAQLRDYLQVIAQQATPVDTLAKFGQSGAGIQLLSFAAAAGRRFDTVVVAGLQEGAWPNPAIRNQLFDSGDICDLSMGRAVISSVDKADLGQILRQESESHSCRIVKDWRSERKAILEDEKMLFESACARAENKLYVAAVAGEEERPSIFYRSLRKKYPQAEVTSLELMPDEGQQRGAAEIEVSSSKANDVASGGGETDFNPANMRELVGELRRLIVKDRAKSKEYAQMISILAELGVENAAPENWRQYGQVGQKEFYSASENTIIADGQQVSISPSRLSALMKCPLRSFLEQYQGSGEDSSAAMVGTALHAVAEKMINESPTARREAFFNLLPEAENNWADRDCYQKYEEMIARLNYYLDNTKNRKILAVEKSYRVAVSENTVLNLRIDRMEEIEGKTHIVDFKTGKPITVDQARENPQLGCYQLAVAAEDEKSEIKGAALVYLSERAARMGAEVPKELSQPPLSETESANLLQAVEDSAQIMRRPYLVAVRNDSCQYCKLKKTCPISGEGAQLW